MIIYGSNLCPDVQKAIEVLQQQNIPFELRDFSKDLMALKEFLAIRDENPLFDKIKAEKMIGIPCFVLSNHVVTLDIDAVLEEYKKNK